MRWEPACWRSCAGERKMVCDLLEISEDINGGVHDLTLLGGWLGCIRCHIRPRWLLVTYLFLSDTAMLSELRENVTIAFHQVTLQKISKSTILKDMAYQSFIVILRLSTGSALHANEGRTSRLFIRSPHIVERSTAPVAASFD
ncbi:hypothetical protein C8T65DRAFT_658750 [Cerioporus squamosus]|nr:hypothetical protein C8T65DRAFT_658750 [Cerioporus squamosus]